MNNDPVSAVQLASDVLERLDAGKLHTHGGHYLHPRYSATHATPDSFWRSLPGDNLQPVVDIIEAGCNVCAAGSLFLSYIRLKNNITGQQLLENAGGGGGGQGTALFTATLQTIFSAEQLALIEAAFERNTACPLSHCQTNNPELRDGQHPSVKERQFCEAMLSAVAFGRQFCNTDGLECRPSECLAAIMQNIVDNNGIFKPEQPTPRRELSCPTNN